MNLFFWKKKQVEKETIREPLSLDLSGLTSEDIDKIFKYGKSSDSIGPYKSKSFIELPYGVVKKDLPMYQREGLVFESVELILGCQYKNLDLSFASRNEIFQFIIWIKEQIAFINDREERYLQSEPDPEMIAAGIDRLNVHGEILTIDSLAKGDILNHKKIEKLPYHQVFKKLLIDKDIRSFEKRYAKVLEAKNKRIGG